MLVFYISVSIALNTVLTKFNEILTHKHVNINVVKLIGDSTEYNINSSKFGLVHLFKISRVVNYLKQVIFP